jgi:NAD(P)-dependent dehydrogenase (short-subunit alcohol dehydrogenase family)
MCRYGDIGRACARLAKAYGMRVLALRRRPADSSDDPLIDEVYGSSGINEVRDTTTTAVTHRHSPLAWIRGYTLLSSFEAYGMRVLALQRRPASSTRSTAPAAQRGALP